jgi:serine phosphatase RsbU (regulator of sigma subunit)
VLVIRPGDRDGRGVSAAATVRTVPACATNLRPLWRPLLSMVGPDRPREGALVDLALRLGRLDRRDAVLRTGAATLASVLQLPAAWSREVPVEPAIAAGGATTGEPCSPLVFTDHDRLRAYVPTLAMRLPRPGYDAWVVARLVIDGESLGALGFASTAERQLDDDTLALTTVAARLVSQRLRLMEARAREHELAQRLQLSLLPAIAPVEGLEVECRYHPAGADALAGGDFYDVVALDSRLTAVLIGDVAGHGVDAAAASGEVRYLARGMLEHTRDPAQVLQLIERALGRGWRPMTMVTLLCSVIDTERDELRTASAGHGPPFVRGVDGDTTLVRIEPSPPLGAGLVLAATPTTTVIPFRGGDVAVFYTDGLVERRATPIDEMLDVVLCLVAAHRSPAALCSALEDLAMTPPGQADDVALLVVRRARGPA